jgi:predicted metal-dependent HD superfamily phosphohydrolase
MTELERYWPLEGHAEVRDRLLVDYSEPSRGYHDIRHLAEVLENVELLAADVDIDRDAVLLAAWFHDAVYEGHDDDEERSAQLAREQLGGRVPAALVDEVARLVRLTRHHRPEEGDLDGEVLCDADLAILAAGEKRYAEYVEGVRREYEHVDDAVFDAGRAAVLTDLIAKKTLFHTRFAQQHWEAAARANIERELQQRRLP